MSPPPRLTAVLFDAGGTLIHLDGARICRAAGVDADLSLFSRAEVAAMDDMREWIAEHPESTDAERLPVFLAGILGRLGLAGEDERREAAFAVVREHARANLWSHAAEGAAETLGRLQERGYRMGVVSNADGRVRRLLEDAGLSPYLDVVIDSSEVGLEKPDARIFLAATERLSVAPSACAYVGDIYEIDVLGARAAGLHAILIGSGAVPDSDAGVDRVRSLPDLLEMFP